MYEEQQDYNSRGYGSYPNDGSQSSGYGHTYQSYHRQNDSLKGKLEQKYWKTKQKVIEKLNKDQDEFVVAGDAEVDARLEAYRHINGTCTQLMMATEAYQNRIFALSQDENEMGRFLRDQGATDKTKAGKMMIAVGKAQSYAAQQRLSLRVPLVRLYQELETFRFRAVADTTVTVERMEKCRSDYRAGLLWMAEVSKELDPDVNKRLDKFRDVQGQVKDNRKKFEKLKADVCQKIDLLSASRCNLLSATLAAYQQCMLKFLEHTSKSYQSVLEQFKGHPSYQFTILRHIIPNNGIADDEEDDIKPGKRRSREIEKGQEVEENGDAAGEGNQETQRYDAPNGDDDDKLISFDTSVNDEAREQEPDVDEQTAEETQKDPDLLGIFDAPQNGGEQSHDHYSAFESSENAKGIREFEDLLGGLDQTVQNDFKMSMTVEKENRDILSEQTKESDDQANSAKNSVDDLLFGSTEASQNQGSKSDIDLLSDVLGSTTFNEKAYLSEDQSGFSKQWQDMFGQQPVESTKPPTDMLLEGDLETETAGNMYMPSFLMEQMRQADPIAAQNGAPKGNSAAKESSDKSKGKNPKSKKGQDMSAWFNLFSDLDPLANPDAIGKGKDADQERSC